MMKITKVAQRMVKEQKLENKGYRVAINGGGAQLVGHLHVHLLGPLSKTAKM
jgi:diadenosine tetraphosphate (Ap4A) HIT family hydrolase